MRWSCLFCRLDLFCWTKMEWTFDPKVGSVQHLLPQCNFFSRCIHPIRSTTHVVTYMRSKIYLNEIYWTKICNNSEKTICHLKMIYVPVPRLNLTPPKISLWPILSWSQTVSSRQRSERSASERSSQLKADSHLGDVVFRQTDVFCFIFFVFSGRR